MVLGCVSAQVKQENEYVVIAGKGIVTDSAWNEVAKAICAKHQGVLLSYNENPEELLPKLQQISPRYVALVEKPENLGRDYIIGMHKLSRKIDNDIFADFLWGVITGYDADHAMKMVNNTTDPLVVKNAVSTITELKSGKWFDRFAWVDDHTKGLWGEKQARGGQVVANEIAPEQVLQKFCDIYGAYAPDLVVTAAHATEQNLEMPFSLGNIRSKDGVLYANFPQNPVNLTESGRRKVYFAVGNCLIGNVNNTKESMAVAWMNSGNAATMIGYVVTTWHGRNGWGGLKYWLTTPGRYSLAEAVYLNQQDMLVQLNDWSPKLLDIEYPFDDRYDMRACGMLIQNAGIERPTNDQIGFVHDRDVLAYYGDPKWNVRLQEIPEENDFTVTSKIKGKRCIVTITTKENFSSDRLKGDNFKEEHVKELPFSYFFPKRLDNPRLAAGQAWKAVADENFLLIYNPDFQPDKTYIITLDID